MSLVAVSGKVSHVDRIIVSLSGSGGGNPVDTEYETTLRVAGRPLKMLGAINWAAR